MIFQTEYERTLFNILSDLYKYQEEYSKDNEKNQRKNQDLLNSSEKNIAKSNESKYNIADIIKKLESTLNLNYQIHSTSLDEYFDFYKLKLNDFKKVFEDSLIDEHKKSQLNQYIDDFLDYECIVNIVSKEKLNTDDFNRILEVNRKIGLNLTYNTLKSIYDLVELKINEELDPYFKKLLDIDNYQPNKIDNTEETFNNKKIVYFSQENKDVILSTPKYKQIVDLSYFKESLEELKEITDYLRIDMTTEDVVNLIIKNYKKQMDRINHYKK